MRNKILLLAIKISDLVTGCSNSQEKVPEGKLNDQQVFFEYGIYYTPEYHLQKSDVIELIMPINS